jgi:hypothetical protein
VFVGHHRGAVAPPDTSLSPLKHSSSDLCQSEKEKSKILLISPMTSSVLTTFFCLVPAASILGQRRCYLPRGKGDPITRGHRCYGGCSRCGRACCRDFRSGSCYDTRQCNPLYQGCLGPGRSSGRGGTRVGVRSRSGEFHSARLFSC